MAVKEADLTGIDNVNEYYTNHYLHTMFANSIQTDITAWKNAVKENADVVVCPICARPDLEFSHEADLLEVK